MYLGLWECDSPPLLLLNSTFVLSTLTNFLGKASHLDLASWAPFCMSICITHFINMCILMCALHHARIMCITHYSSLHRHHKFICISIICSYAYTSYYMHLIISINMDTIPLMHNSSICIGIASMSHWCATYPVKSHCTTNGMKDVANTRKISNMWASHSEIPVQACLFISFPLNICKKPLATALYDFTILDCS
jgi:hypothetical protein